MAFDIQEELKKLPARPGVYIMHDAKDAIIYVGKAVSLKNRVRQYFQTSRNKGVKIERMVTQIARFEYIVTDSELEALVLECNLIKEYRPKYNTMLKDDKSYPFIKVTVNEPFPRVLFARRMRKDKAKYFGPYTSAGAVKDVIELVQKLYHIRTCNRSLPRDIGKERPCLYYHIHQCHGPCQGKVSQEEYHRQIQGALQFLNGNSDEILRELEEKMRQAAEELRFEDAAAYRDLCGSIRKIKERQKITSYGEEDKDVVAMAMEGQDAVVQVFFVREGKLIGRGPFLSESSPRRQQGAGAVQFSETVLCRDTVYSPGDYAAERDRRWRNHRRVAFRKAGTESISASAEEGTERKTGRAGGGECPNGSGKRQGKNQERRGKNHRRGQGGGRVARAERNSADGSL